MRNTLTLLAFFCVVSIAPAALAADECVRSASARYGLPEELLRAIADVESKQNPYKVGVNPNRSVDIGMMQINSGWLPTLNRYGVKLRDLFDACTNVFWGAWILSQKVERYGLSWKAVGAYNAKSPDKQAAYAWRVYRALQRREQ
jgi:soluble lytic murein transglycosylase-like protein